MPNFRPLVPFLYVKKFVVGGGWLWWWQVAVSVGVFVVFVVVGGSYVEPTTRLSQVEVLKIDIPPADAIVLTPPTPNIAIMTDSQEMTKKEAISKGNFFVGHPVHFGQSLLRAKSALYTKIAILH